MSSPQHTKIFFMGATGYIGGSALNRLISHPDASTFVFTALVRSAAKASKLEAIGIKTVVGNLKDDALVETLASEADIVISTADVDDLEIATAYLKGMKRYHEATGKVPILIHTSGTGVLADTSAGYFTNVSVYNDADPDQIETLAITQQHRTVDLAIVQADKEGYIKSYIILPSMIYGIAEGRLVDLGIQNKYSTQIPELIKAALGRGRGGTVGAGTNKWVNVHISDLSALYLLLFNLARNNPGAVGHGREGFYFGINGECTLYEIGKAIAEKLVSIGKATNPEPSTFTDEEINLYFRGSTFWGTNSRGIANRSKSIGWNPHKTAQDLLASISLEVDTILKEQYA